MLSRTRSTTRAKTLEIIMFSLPSDGLRCIASHGDARTLYMISLVCRGWKSILADCQVDDEIWKAIALRRFPLLETLLPSTGPPTSWKSIYRLQSLAEHPPPLVKSHPPMSCSISDFVFSVQIGYVEGAGVDPFLTWSGHVGDCGKARLWTDNFPPPAIKPLLNMALLPILSPMQTRKLFRIVSSLQLTLFVTRADHVRHPDSRTRDPHTCPLPLRVTGLVPNNRPLSAYSRADMMLNSH